MAAILVLLGSATIGCEYVAHPNTIGPKSEQAKKDEFTCSRSASCISEAEAACNSESNCSSFGYNPRWETARAQLYTTHWNASYGDSGWTLYACEGDPPPVPGPSPPPPPPPPPPRPPPPPLPPVGSCRTDLDCSLNGACDASTGICTCDAPWKHGPSKKEACNTLDVLPHPNTYVPAYGGPRTDTAYRVQNLTSWGGNILYDSHDGMYHLFVSRMGGGKGLSSWGGNSQIDHAVATDPMDQFKYTDTALKAEAHNSSPLRSQNRSWLLFHIGNGGGASDAASSSFLHHSASPAGPWHPLPGVAAGCNNPAPMFHNNVAMAPSIEGTAYVGCNSGGFKLYRSDDVFAGGWEYVTQINIGAWAAGTHAEDPYTWMDPKGRWHLLAHRWDYKDGWPANPQQTMPVLVSGHGFSLDGIEWHFNVAEQPYNPWVTFENGTQQNFSTYERPHLVFNNEGCPTHLVNGVSPYWFEPGTAGPCDQCDARPGSAHSCVVCKTTKGIDYTYTLVTKLNV